MKHLPNILTLSNLFCGCIAICFALNSQPYLSYIGTEEAPYWITGTEQSQWAGIMIGIAALFDVLDGWCARMLNIYSPIGKDLDSLADIVSFGVAPAAIMFKMLWAANIAQPDALTVSMWSTSPAFLIACFGALRLARFNVFSKSGSSFEGIPIPAIGILIASFPFINAYQPNIGILFKNTWLLYGIIALCCALMVSKMPFFKLIPKSWQMKHLLPRIIIILTALIGFLLIGWASIPLVFLMYVVLSLFYKDQTAITNE